MSGKCSRKDGENFETQFGFFQGFFTPFSTVICGEKCDEKCMLFFTTFCSVHTSEKVKTFLTHFSLGIMVKNLKYSDSSFSVGNLKASPLSFPPQNSSVFQVKILMKNLNSGSDPECQSGLFTILS
jgi:hypothetical protein